MDARLTVFIVLSLADLFLTWLLIRYSGGQIGENNPIASVWLARFGWEGLVVFKVAAMSVVGAAAVLIWARRPRLGKWLLTLGCLLVGMVVLYSYSLLRTRL
jgi:hypothetical protein